MLTWAKAKKLSMLKWELILENPTQETFDSLEFRPEFKGLISQCGLCQYAIEQCYRYHGQPESAITLLGGKGSHTWAEICRFCPLHRSMKANECKDGGEIPGNKCDRMKRHDCCSCKCSLYYACATPIANRVDRTDLESCRDAAKNMLNRIKSLTKED